MLTIWGRNTSSNVMKVLWACDELGLPYRREDVGGPFGRTKEPFYLAMNPNSTVPTIVDSDGFALWESNAILRYLAGRPGGEALFPAQPQARAVVDQWMEWQTASLNPRMMVLFLGLIRTPEAQRDMAAIGAASEQGVGLYNMLEAQLEGREYLTGNFSLADIAIGPLVHRWFALPLERPAQPWLRAWYERLLARPAYRTHCSAPLS